MHPLERYRTGMTVLEMTIAFAVIFVFLFTLAPLFLKAQIRSNEELIAETMLDLAGAQQAFYVSNLDRQHYGSMSDLLDADPPYVDPLMRGGVIHGYKILMTVDGMDSWYASAAPRIFRVTGIRSFYIDQSGVLKAGIPEGDPWIDRKKAVKMLVAR